MRRAYAKTKTPASVLNTFFLLVSALTPLAPFPSRTSFTAAPTPSSMLALLTGLSDLQISLLIAASRLEVFAQMDIISFAMVYDEYLALCTNTRLSKIPGGQNHVWGKAIARSGWEGLENLGLVIDAGERGPVRWMRLQIGLEELMNEYQGTGWARWCREVM